MAIYTFGTGAETNQEVEFDSYDAGFNHSSVNPKSGTYCYELDYNFFNVNGIFDVACKGEWTGLPTYNNWAVSFQLRLDQLPVGNWVQIFTAIGVALTVRPDGKFQLTSSGTVIGTQVLSTGTYYQIELRKIDGDTVYLRIDESETNDIEKSIDSASGNFAFFGLTSKNDTDLDPACIFRIDDIAFWISDAGELPPWLNTCSITTTGINGGGTHNDFESGRAVFTDHFAQSTSDQTLTARTPNVGTGWTVLSQVNSGLMRTQVGEGYAEAQTATGNTGVMYTADATYPSADYSVWLDSNAVVNSPDVAYLAGRITNSSNFYAIEFSANVCQLYSVVAGTWTALGSDFGDRMLNNADIELRMVGTTISMLIGGVEATSVTNSDHTSAGKGGIGMGANRTATDDMDGGQQLDVIYIYDLKNDALEENIDEIPGAALDNSFNKSGKLAGTAHKQSHTITGTTPAGTIKGFTLYSRFSSVGGNGKHLIRESSTDYTPTTATVFTYSGYDKMPSGANLSSASINALEVGSEQTENILSTEDIGLQDVTPIIFFNSDGTHDDNDWAQTGGIGNDAHTVLNDNNLSTYVEHNTPGDRQGLKLGKFKDEDNLVDRIIVGVAFFFNVDSDGADGTFKMYYRNEDNNTYYYTDTYTSGGGNRRYRWGVNPKTGNAWTHEELYSGEFGMEIVTAAGVNLQYKLSRIEIWKEDRVREQAHWINIIHGDAPTEFEAAAVTFSPKVMIY